MAPRKFGPPSTTPVIPPPTCLVCEMEIPWMGESGIAGSLEYDQSLKDQCRGYWKSSLKHVMVPSTQVEEAWFGDFPRLWSCFCRAIIKDSDTKYHLTGIDLVQHHACRTGPCQLPKDPTGAGIDGRARTRNKKGIFEKFYPAKMGRQPSQYKGKRLGFIVHAHCWVLFGRALGVMPTEIKLSKFIRSFRNHWRREKLDGLEDPDIDSIKPNQALSSLQFSCDIYQNPLVIPALQEAIRRATIGHSISSRFSKLPVEITILISELICPADYALDDVENMRSMLVAFQWNLPDWFWQRRLREDLFFELDVLRKSSSPVNWQMLQLDLMALVSDHTWYATSGLANRERILRNVVAVGRDLGLS
ncbi:hypothetical protein N7527_006254 [Penicillium freii]|nr:hypothetical protein N7527_006254 [Penicillium freii]